MRIHIYILLIIFLEGIGGKIYAQEHKEDKRFHECYLNDPSHGFVKYDSIISNFHATLIWGADSAIYGWGENMSPKNGENILLPTKITPENGFNYEGTPLKMAAGSRGIHSGQYALLTTKGVYVWGEKGNLVSKSIKKDSRFSAVTVDGQKNGLPASVQPEDIKMFFGTYLTLAIVTNDGEAWLLSGIGRKGGNGINKNRPNQWVRVCVAPEKALKKVVAIRGTPFTLMALTASGEIYTWGGNTFLGNGGRSSNLFFATRMFLPEGVHPKMIGMTADNLMPSYYLLTTDGKLYSLGYNSKKQLGVWNTFEQRFWQQPLKPDSLGEKSGKPFTNVAWISPNEHDGSGFPAINILTEDGKLYAWGWNHRDMIGGKLKNKAYNPILMPGELNEDAVVKAVETGGHTTFVLIKNRAGYGYVGHKIFGSMGDGTHTERTGNKYLFVLPEK